MGKSITNQNLNIAILAILKHKDTNLKDLKTTFADYANLRQISVSLNSLHLNGLVEMTTKNEQTFYHLTEEGKAHYPQLINNWYETNNLILNCISGGK